MTPLAQRIVKELTLPLKRRTFADHAKLLPLMGDVHCFDCSEVYPAAFELCQDMARRPEQIGRLAFLPAPKTWIEFKSESAAPRLGILLREVRTGGLPHSASLDYGVSVGFQSMKGGVLELTAALKTGQPPIVAPTINTQRLIDDERITYILYAFLALINTPRIIGRRQHMPHRGLERQLIANQKIVGKFPLHAWTEIKLDINTPRDATSDDPTEAHLTGRRALHFCRAHLRIRLGRLEIVSSHWRGDPALGIKQARYKLTQKEVGAGA